MQGSELLYGSMVDKSDAKASVALTDAALGVGAPFWTKPAAGAA